MKLLTLFSISITLISFQFGFFFIQQQHNEYKMNDILNYCEKVKDKLDISIIDEQITRKEAQIYIKSIQKDIERNSVIKKRPHSLVGKAVVL